MFSELDTAVQTAGGAGGNNNNDDDDHDNNNDGDEDDDDDAGDGGDREEGVGVRGGGGHGHGHHHLAHSVRDLVSTTLTLSSRRHKKKQQATVKPIKASDEKVMDAAIAMANALASKSMHDLDKRHLAGGEDLYDGGGPPPAPSPLTPNSPSKKFAFWFPGGKHSPKGERKPFSEEVNAAGAADAQSLLTPGAIDAYRALIDGQEVAADEEEKCCSSSSPRSPKSPGSQGSEGVFGSPSSSHQQQHQQQQQQRSPPPLSPTGGRMSSPPRPPPPAPAPAAPAAASTGVGVGVGVFVGVGDNPLPLPPKTARLNLSQPPKRHVRKNPLIIPSGAAANLLSRRGKEEEEQQQQQQQQQQQPQEEEGQDTTQEKNNGESQVTQIF